MAASLTTATEINKIDQGDARTLPVDHDSYPAVLVKLMREREEFDQIGQRRNRYELEFSVVPIIHEGSSPQASDRDIMTLTKNTKLVLQSNITLSSTALWTIVDEVNYAPLDINGVYYSASIMTLRTVHLST